MNLIISRNDPHYKVFFKIKLCVFLPKYNLIQCVTSNFWVKISVNVYHRGLKKAGSSHWAVFVFYRYWRQTKHTFCWKIKPWQARWLKSISTWYNCQTPKVGKLFMLDW